MSEEEASKARARERAAAERKATEDLLAGFDRPGRSPRVPVKRDFVEHHLESPNEAAAKKAPAIMADGRADETVLVPRQTSGKIPRWLPWAALLIAMPLGGAVLAYVMIRTESPLPPSPTTTTVVSAAATTSIAVPVPVVSTSMVVGVGSTAPSVEPYSPLPPPTIPHVGSSSKPKGVMGGPTPSVSSSSDPRGDFMRKL